MFSLVHKIPTALYCVPFRGSLKLYCRKRSGLTTPQVPDRDQPPIELKRYTKQLLI